MAFKDGRVSFRYKDYAHGSTERILSLGALEFLRRFLLHVLPSGFQRIRYYGLLANCCRQGKIALCRELIGAAVIPPHTDGVPSNSQLAAVRCPECGLGVMVTIGVVEHCQSAQPCSPEQRSARHVHVSRCSDSLRGQGRTHQNP